MKYRDPETGEFKELYTKAADTLPVGTVVDFDGAEVPAGWEEAEETDNYSTEETFTGKYWVDGKKIYRKVVDLGTLVNADTKLITSGISEQIYPIKIYGFAIKSDEMFPLPFIWGDTSTFINYCGLFYDRENNQFYFKTNRDMSAYTGIGILEYTKTTDTVEESEE